MEVFNDNENVNQAANQSPFLNQDLSQMSVVSLWFRLEIQNIVLHFSSCKFLTTIHSKFTHSSFHTAINSFQCLYHGSIDHFGLRFRAVYLPMLAPYCKPRRFSYPRSCLEALESKALNSYLRFLNASHPRQCFLFCLAEYRLGVHQSQHPSRQMYNCFNI